MERKRKAYQENIQVQEDMTDNSCSDEEHIRVGHLESFLTMVMPLTPRSLKSQEV